MVKYYFQSMNGSLSFVHAGTKEELEEKVKKEFGGDKAEVEAKIKAQIADAEKKLADLEAIEPKTEKERLEKETFSNKVISITLPLLIYHILKILSI